MLLLDEPAAGMNPKETAELTKLIYDMREQLQLTIILIEHDMKLVMEISEHIIVLDHGEKLLKVRRMTFEIMKKSLKLT